MPGGPVHPLVGDAAAIQSLRRLIGDLGLKVLDVEALWLLPEMVAESIRPALEASAEIGARYFLVSGNDPEWGRMAGNLARVTRMAAEYKLKIAIEPISYCEVSTLEHAKRLMSQAGIGDAGIILDVLHFCRAGQTPAMLADFDLRLISYIQLSDARAAKPDTREGLTAEARGDRLIPGAGGLPLHDILDALPPDLPIVAELPTKEFADLPVDEVARRSGQACREYLAVWQANRTHARTTR